MKLNAKQRLLADDDHVAREKREKLDHEIEKLEEQITNLKKGLPSKFNKMAVSQSQQINIRKQIVDIHDKILNLRKQKLQIK